MEAGKQKTSTHYGVLQAVYPDFVPVEGLFCDTGDGGLWQRKEGGWLFVCSLHGNPADFYPEQEETISNDELRRLIERLREDTASPEARARRRSQRGQGVC